MTRSVKIDRDAVIDAGMQALATDGFGAFRSLSFLHEMGLQPTDLRREFGDIYGLIVAAMRRLNADMIDAADHLEADDSPRDRLFEVFMSRFESAGPWRDAIAAIAQRAPRDPLLGLALLRAGDEAMATALEASDIDATGPIGHLRMGVLATLVYLPALRVWLNDDTPDFAKTMRALDRGLGRLEAVSSRLDNLGRRPRGQDPSPKMDEPEGQDDVTAQGSTLH